MFSVTRHLSLAVWTQSTPCFQCNVLLPIRYSLFFSTSRAFTVEVRLNTEISDLNPPNYLDVFYHHKWLYASPIVSYILGCLINHVVKYPPIWSDVHISIACIHRNQSIIFTVSLNYTYNDFDYCLCEAIGLTEVMCSVRSLKRTDSRDFVHNT